MSKKLSIIIPVYNNWKYTKNCINDLKNLPSNHEIYVVDDGSTDNTKKKLVQTYEEWDGKASFGFTRREHPLGFAKSCNLGFCSTTSEYVMFLNNDIKVMSNKETWTENLLKHVGEAIIGPTVGVLDHNLNFVCESKKFPKNGHFYISGWNITASRETWNKLVKTSGAKGPFCTDFSRVYFEDTDLGFRAREQSIEQKVVFAPVQHLGKTTTKQIDISKHYKESKEIFLAKWKERAQKLF